MGTTSILTMASKQSLIRARARADAIADAYHREEEAKAAARRQAIAETLDAWLDDMPEAQRVALFQGLEAKAKAKNRRLIKAHPMRPERCDERTGEAG